MNIFKTVFVMLGLFIPAYSLTVDFAPIQVGNVWVYEKSYENRSWATSPTYNITKTIQVTETRSSNDTIYFSAFIRDSGVVVQYSPDSNWIDCRYYVQGFKTKDAVITGNANDSIVTLEKGNQISNIGDLFPFPLRDTAGRDSAFMSEKFYSMGGLIIDSYAYFSGSPASVYIDSCLLVQSTGLLARTTISIFYIGGNAIGGTSTIRLISFNGKPAPDINFTSVNHSPQNKRRNSNQTAFRQLLWINQGNHIGPQNVRAVFDMRGRAVSASGVTNRHLNNGIYLYSH
jgi:hypothetical protein